MAAPSNIYPFATQDGQAIPLDIIRPAAAIRLAATATVQGPVTVPATYSIAVFRSDVACLVRFGSTFPAPLVSGTSYPDILYIPEKTLVISVIPSTALYFATVGATPADLWVQVIEKWAGLGLEKQYTRK